MKKITKLFFLMVIMLISSSVIFAQNYPDRQTNVLDDEQKLEIQQHGPTIVVPVVPPGGGRAVGDDCTSPIVINAGALPFSYSDPGQTNCGRGNTYMNTSLGSYDGGEDIMYELVVTETGDYVISMDPNGTTWTGIGLFPTCPPAYNAISYKTGSSGTTVKVIDVSLDPGTYYIMVDTWPSPTCIPNFDLTITGTPPPPPVTSYPYLETFTGTTMPAGWTNWSTDPWKFSGSCSYGATADHTNGTSNANFAWHDDSSPYTNPSNLDARTFDLTSITTPLMVPVLNFWYWIGRNNNPGSTLHIDIYDGATWTTDVGVYGYTGEWTEAEIDLSPYSSAGTIVRFRSMENTSYFNCDISLDDVGVRGVAIGDVEGTVYNGDGLPMPGATVSYPAGGMTTTTNGAGFYQLFDVDAGLQELTAWKAGYNTTTATVDILSGGLVVHDFVLTKPLFTIYPLFLDETLNPNEYLTTYLGILNTGSGQGEWSAAINFFSKAPSNSVNETVEIPNVEILDNRTFLTDGEVAPFPETVYNNYARGSRSDLDIAIVTSALPAANNFTELGNALLGLGINSYTVIALQPLTTTADDLLAYDGVLFGLNTFFTVPTGPVGNMLADYIDAGGKLILTSPINATGYTNLPIAGRLLTDGYDPCTTGALNGATVSTGTFDDTHPIMEGVTSYGGGLTINCQASTDAELVASFNTNTAFVATKTITNPVVHVNVFVAASGWTSGDVPLVIYNAFNWLQSGASGGWLSLGVYDGMVPGNGGSQNVAVNFDATGTAVGEVYTAEIVISTTPDVGTFTIPVTMTIFGDPLTPATDLTVEVVNEVTGQVNLSWMFASRVTFQYFRVKRDGIAIGTTTNLFYTDYLPNYGEYCYTVTPVFDEGNGVPAGPECIEWVIPALCWTPATMYNEQWADSQEEVILTLDNCGDGTLEFVFPDYYSGKGFACDNEIWLYDSFGDGWNGTQIDVLVNGAVVLNNITLSSGSGPAVFAFPVEGGDDISVVEVVTGSWHYECSYEIYDADGNLMYDSPYNVLNLAAGTVFGTCPQPSYITSVVPATGQIPSGSSLDITLTYDATDFPAGLYDEWLNIETNDPLRLEDSIFNQMLVYIPAQLYGTVTDCNTGLGLNHVTVTANGAGDFSAETNSSGYYEMYVDEGTYDVYFELLGFETSVIGGVFAPTGVGTEVSTTMCETPYPVNWVFADPNGNDTECMVTWTLPMGPYAIIYDDGEADDMLIWAYAGGAVGVHFTPAGYPATVLGGRLNVGDGSFPAGGNFLGTPMAVGVMDDDGVNGLPGTVLDSVVVTVNNYGWVDFDGVFNRTFTDGDFYIVMWQLGWAANSAPIAIDTDLPTVYRSASKMPGAPWSISVYQDFMIRAYVSGPNAGVMSNSSTDVHVQMPKVIEGPYLATSLPSGVGGTIKHGEFRPIEGAVATRDLSNYTIARASNFDPDLGPQTGTLTPLSNPTGLSYNDAAFGGLDAGFYAYAVKAIYESNESVWVYSNTVAHGLANEFTVEITQCDGLDPDNAEVTLVGQDYPYQVWYDVTGTDGIVVFDSVIDGMYDLFVYKMGYQLYEHYNLAIYNDATYSIVLVEKTYKPTNLFVEPLTSVATWGPPSSNALPIETFEGEDFPPAGWEMLTDGEGWFRTNNGSSSFWSIPPGDGYYACDNDDGAPSGNNGRNDYLVTPMLDLSGFTDYTLYFSSFFTGAYSQSAYVEYSFDGGSTWEVLMEMEDGTSWEDIAIDVSAFAGPGAPPIWFAFHADDNGYWASGWAVDNVEVSSSQAPEDALGYYVYLDGAFVGQTTYDVMTYTFMDLNYGQTYTAAVRCLYSCGVGEPIEYTWQSTYLHPPRNIGDEYIYGTNEVPLMWNPPMTGTIPMGAMSSSILPIEPIVSDDRTFLTDGEIAPFPETVYNYISKGSRADLDIAIVTSALPASNDFTELSNALLALGINSITVIALQPLTTTADDLLVFDGVLFGLNTFFTVPTEPVGDMLADYIDAGGKLILTSPINATGYTNLPIAGRMLDDGYDPCTTGGLNGSTVGTGTFDDTHPIMEGVTAYGGGLTITCNASTDAELVASFNTNTAFVATKTITNPVVHVNSFVAASGWTTGDVPLVIYNAFNWLQSSGPPPSGIVPPGLSSFNLYRDGENIANVPYADQGVDEWVTYVDNNLDPGTYLYDVSAVYDLTDYGFPGQFAESAWNGSDTVDVVWGFGLPFYEGWDNGTFSFQGWRFNDQSENWVINSQIGDPEPSAEFTWDPLLELNYSSTLTSNPITADLLTEGSIFFDFDLALDDRNSTGLEVMKVEVYDGAGWNEVASFANDGSFDFTMNHINITNYSMGRVFQIRFNATGQNSFDIISWFVDNIYIYRECTPPTDLVGAYVWNQEEDFGAEVCWEAPYVPGPVSDWIHWDDGVNFTGIGLDGPATWSLATRWDAGQLIDYAGTSITKISYFPQDDSWTDITLKVWKGANAATLVYEEDVTAISVTGMWNEVTLGTPVALDVTDELWVGYTVTQGVAGFPGGCDAGPAVAGYGDMLTLDGNWESMANSYGLNYNWNIQAYVTGSSSATSVSLIDDTEYSSSTLSLGVGPIKSEPIAVTHNDSRDITGFNVYRMEEGGTGYELYDVVDYVDGQSTYCYFDAYPNVEIQMGYYYQVTANFASDTDACESAPAMALELPMDDFVYVFVTSIDDPNAALTSLYPNPAQDMVTVTSTLPMTQLTVTNYVGQVVYKSEMNDATSTVLNTSSYQSGVYLVKIDTENGVVTKRVIISR